MQHFIFRQISYSGSSQGSSRNNMDHQLEETFREMCCIGNIAKARTLVERGINVNSTNQMNGWTALHWAAKRGHKNIVEFLIQEAADVTVRTTKGELASSLTTDAEITEMLDGLREETKTVDNSSNFVPNYLRNPEFFYVQNSELPQRIGSESICLSRPEDEELVLKLRVADSEDSDFIEVELPKSQLTYRNLLNVCCEELDIKADHTKKIRKLPNTTLRKDKDVARLQPFQELEIVLIENVVSQ